MVPRQELLPEIVRFANTVYRLNQGWSAASSFVTAKARFAAFLVDLKTRLAWELPLLGAFEQGSAQAQAVAQGLETLETALQGSTSEGDWERELSPALEHFLTLMRDAEALRNELPEFTDVKIVNELLWLATSHLEGRSDNVPIGQRLPVLIDWVNRKQTDWQTYLRLFPDQQVQVEPVMAVFEAMRNGIGALYLFLEGEDPDGLKAGLQIILRALEVLAQASETRFLTESERIEFSPDLRLERIWRGADWPDWQASSLPADLLSFYQESIRQIVSLSQRTLIPASVLEETTANATEIQGILIEDFEQLWGQLTLTEQQSARPQRADALAELESCRSALARALESVASTLQPYRALESFPLYSNLVAVLEGILREETPDAYLHQLLQALADGQARFQEVIQQTNRSYAQAAESSGPARSAADLAINMSRRFDLPVASRGPELVFDGAYEVVVAPGQEGAGPTPQDAQWDSESDQPLQEGFLVSAWEALEQHHQASELLWEYLRDGDRLAVHEAYELFAEPFLTLSDFVVPDPESKDVSCPFCAHSFPAELDRCPSCRRLITISEVASDGGSENIAGPPIGSALLQGLDARTRSLSGSADRRAVVGEWKALAKRLESMARAARNEGKGPHLDLLLADLVASCHQVSDVLQTETGGYSELRGPLLQKFSALERMVSPAR